MFFFKKKEKKCRYFTLTAHTKNIFRDLRDGI